MASPPGNAIPSSGKTLARRPRESQGVNWGRAGTMGGEGAVCEGVQARKRSPEARALFVFLRFGNQFMPVGRKSADKLDTDARCTVPVGGRPDNLAQHADAAGLMGEFEKEGNHTLDKEVIVRLEAKSPLTDIEESSPVRRRGFGLRGRKGLEGIGHRNIQLYALAASCIQAIRDVGRIEWFGRIHVSIHLVPKK